MKQKDIALIVVIVAISAVVSFVVSNKIFVTPSNRMQEVEHVQAISPTFQPPDPKYFNSTSIDPAQSSATGANSNKAPFSGGN